MFQRLIVVLLANLMHCYAMASDSYVCADGRTIETTDSGSREQRAKTANLLLREVPKRFDELPGWGQGTSPNSLLRAMHSNCRTSKLPEGWSGVCADLQELSPEDVYDYIAQKFLPFQLMVGDDPKGKVTSYYASSVNVSRVRTEKYQHPLYKFSEQSKRLSREKIVAGALPDSEVLFWADNAFDVDILHIQGSGVGKLPTGEKVNIVYAGKNQSNYVSLGKVLRECGDLKPNEISLPTIRAWVKSATSKEYSRLIGNNQSYVFFSEEKYMGISPKGALGVPLTPMRSLAVDTRYVPLGTLMYLSVPHPLDNRTIESAFLAQDKGGAINGGIRADIFAGEGEAAADFAGNMAHGGLFWILKPKDTMVRVPSE